MAFTLLAMVTAAAQQTVSSAARAAGGAAAALAALAAAENALAAARVDPSLRLGVRRARADDAALQVTVAPADEPGLWRLSVEAVREDGGVARLATLTPARRP